MKVMKVYNNVNSKKRKQNTDSTMNKYLVIICFSIGLSNQITLTEALAAVHITQQGKANTALQEFAVQTHQRNQSA